MVDVRAPKKGPSNIATEGLTTLDLLAAATIEVQSPHDGGFGIITLRYFAVHLLWIYEVLRLPQKRRQADCFGGYIWTGVFADCYTCATNSSDIGVRCNRGVGPKDQSAWHTTLRFQQRRHFCCLSSTSGRGRATSTAGAVGRATQ